MYYLENKTVGNSRNVLYIYNYILALISAKYELNNLSNSKFLQSNYGIVG